MPAVLTGDVASVLSDAHVDAGGTQARGCSGGRAGLLAGHAVPGGRAGLPVGHAVPALWRMHSGRRGEGSLPAAPRGLSPGPPVTGANADRCCGQREAASSRRGPIAAFRRACELFNIGSHRERSFLATCLCLLFHLNLVYQKSRRGKKPLSLCVIETLLDWPVIGGVCVCSHGHAYCL